MHVTLGSHCITYGTLCFSIVKLVFIRNGFVQKNLKYCSLVNVLCNKVSLCGGTTIVEETMFFWYFGYNLSLCLQMWQNQLSQAKEVTNIISEPWHCPFNDCRGIFRTLSNI